jgi:hypothetical protein
MKQAIEQGKVWLIACLISLSAFLFLQLDQDNLQEKQNIASVETTAEEIEEAYQAELSDFDIIKGLSVFVLEILFIKD